ncbi:hypothetical protein SAMN05518672_103426 [Chitinophaga sp. CF118]|uniref:hypothetical protein n=1 Tax=Chitinophaga sp. CF118 TaxID=1884367 RepID=UPI0008EAEC0A|nr:hypothetical protein [Chitinophaga sp. CF118]SFD83489.1 hypothetical protein SAMN05518672_103426 [Chitinophaga sp. CF118]
MLGLTKLTHIVYSTCNGLEYENQPGSLEQYEEQQEALLREERIVRSLIFETALSIVNEDEYKQFISYKLRTLCKLSDLLEDTLVNGTADNGPYTELLQEHALSVIKSLIGFLHDRFSDVIAGINEGAKVSDSQSALARMKLNTSAPILALFARALVDGTDIVGDSDVAIKRYFVKHFSSKHTAEITYTSFRNNFHSPAPATIKKLVIILNSMIHFLHSL